MYPHVFDFKDYLTIAGAFFTLLMIAFFLIWFFYDLKTKYKLTEDQNTDQVVSESEDEEDSAWLDRDLLIMVFVGTALIYGLYFMLYYACRVFHAPWIGAVYWVLCGLFLVILLAYICIAEWYHEEKKFGDVSIYQWITGRPLTQKPKEVGERGEKGVSS